METTVQVDFLNLVRQEHIMTLAVADSGEPWVAPVYYIYSAGSFWFFSSPNSRHIVQAIPEGRAAAAIYVPSTGWRDIRGVQMEGLIERAGVNRPAIQAFKAYSGRFNFVGEIVPGLSHTTSIDDLEKAFRARWYRFVPERIVYCDNSLQFGTRHEIKLP